MSFVLWETRELATNLMHILFIGPKVFINLHISYIRVQI